MTERDMLDLLHRRYGELSQGSGSRYVVAEKVKAGLSFDRRALDFMAVDTQRSRSTGLVGIEVKVSRSDYLRELKAPEKSEEFRKACDKFYIAVSDRSIVRDDCPPWAGIIAPDSSGKLVIIKNAIVPCHGEPSKEFWISFGRAVAKTATRRALEL